ncbi:MAG: chemotaxis protein CheW [Brevinema sp.]
MERQYGAFEVAGVKYCINIMDIKKVIREQSLIKIPNFPSFVEGIINHAGKVIPVLSIQKKLAYHGLFQGDERRLKTSESTVIINENAVDQEFEKRRANILKTSFKLLIVQIEETLVGLLVDTLDQIITVSDTDMQDIYDTNKRDAKMISGVLHVNEEIYYTINVMGILEGEEKDFLDDYLKRQNTK